MSQPYIEITQLDPTIQAQLNSLTGGVVNEVLTWTGVGSGFDWLPNSATSIGGFPVNITSPVDNDVLTYVSGEWINAAPSIGGTVTSVAATGSPGLTIGGSPITTSGTLTFTLGIELQGLAGLITTGVVQRTGLGTYTAADLTSGQITTALGYTPYNATNPAGYITGNQAITLSGDVAGTGTTSITTTLSNTGVTASTYNNVTVDLKGRVTAGSNIAYLTANQNVTITGDATGSGTTSIALTLANTAVSAGSYAGGWGATTISVPSFTVDAKGRLTAASNQNYTRTLLASR